MPTVSVVIPTFNRMPFLGQAVQSVLDQTFADFELLIVDDGSSDGTDKYLAGLNDPRALKFKTHRVGAAGARNEGIENANGGLIAFCDSDDFWAPDKLEKQVAVFKSKNSSALVYSDAKIVGTGKRAESSVLAGREPAKGHVFDSLLLDNFIPTSTVMVAREALEKTSGFESAFVPAEDYRLWLRLALIDKFDFLDEPLSFYRVHEGQIGADLARMFPACADAIDNALMQAGRKSEQIEGLNKRLWQLHFVAARTFMQQQKPNRARRHYQLANNYAPVSKARIFQWLSYIGI